MVGMRALLPHPTADVDVHARYAAGWLEAGGLRVNFVSSVDGGATSAGVSGGLQTPGDNTIFAALRDLADVVLVGAGTAAAEGYKPARPAGEHLAQRAKYGLPTTLPVAVVSRSLHVDPTAALYCDATARTIVLTCATADADTRARLEQVADVVICGEREVDLAAARTALQQRGLTRILCEGGPSLFGDLAAAGLVDELCLSVSPLLAGPGPRRIVGGDDWPDAPHALSLIGLLEEDGALFARYGRG
jgi:riboflavin biosynthesis pyrimidine reductase